jgi:hypothetical protein
MYQRKRAKQLSKEKTRKMFKNSENTEVVVMPEIRKVKQKKSANKIIKKRDQKRSASSKVSTKSLKSKGPSTKVSDTSPEVPIDVVKEVVSQVSQTKKNLITKRKLDDKLYSDRKSDQKSEYTKYISSAKPITRSLIRSGLINSDALHQELSFPRRRLNYNSRSRTSPFEDSPLSSISSPFSDQYMTPVQKYAYKVKRGSARAVRAVGTDWFANIYSISIISFIVLLFAINYFYKIPEVNYSFDLSAQYPYMEFNNGYFKCTPQATQAKHLCAPINNLNFMKDLKSIENIFDELIRARDPYDLTVNKSFVYKVSNKDTFGEIMEHLYVRTRLSFVRTDDHDIFEITIFENFNARTPIWNSIRHFIPDAFVNEENRIFHYCFICLITYMILYLYMSCKLEINDNIVCYFNPRKEAHQIFKKIRTDMYHKKLFRNGIDLSTIYDVYKNQIECKRYEFEAKVVPYIRKYFRKSKKFNRLTNRLGATVWKLK